TSSRVISAPTGSPFVGRRHAPASPSRWRHPERSNTREQTAGHTRSRRRHQRRGDCVSNTTAIQPWDDAAMTEGLLELVQQLPRVRLDQLDAPDVPGAYLQFVAASHLRDVLGVIAEGRYPAYAGL